MCALRLQSTYEESLVNVANKKGGLNEAILGNLASSTSEDPHENAAMISRLLKEGAHSLLGGKYAPPPCVDDQSRCSVGADSLKIDGTILKFSM